MDEQQELLVSFPCRGTMSSTYILKKRSSREARAQTFPLRPFVDGTVDGKLAMTGAYGATMKVDQMRALSHMLRLSRPCCTIDYRCFPVHLHVDCDVEFDSDGIREEMSWVLTVANPSSSSCAEVWDLVGGRLKAKDEAPASLVPPLVGKRSHFDIRNCRRCKE